MVFSIEKHDVKALEALKQNRLKDEKFQKRMHDAFDCFNTWQTNAYLSPEQLMQMESDMTFYVTLAIVSKVFDRGEITDKM